MFNVLYKAFNIFYRISTNAYIPANKVLSVRGYVAKNKYKILIVFLTFWVLESL